jgi:cell division protein FtsL
MACATMLIVCGLLVVGLRIHEVQLGYRLDAIRAERTDLEATLQQLEVEVATLRSPGRVESRARQLGLTVPAPRQVRLAREYVAGGTGVVQRGTLIATVEPSTPLGRVSSPR